jgi:hypothetical protein
MALPLAAIAAMHTVTAFELSNHWSIAIRFRSYRNRIIVSCLSGSGRISVRRVSSWIILRRRLKLSHYRCCVIALEHVATGSIGSPAIAGSQPNARKIRTGDTISLNKPRIAPGNAPAINNVRAITEISEKWQPTSSLSPFLKTNRPQGEGQERVGAQSLRSLTIIRPAAGGSRSLVDFRSRVRPMRRAPQKVWIGTAAMCDRRELRDLRQDKNGARVS